MEAPSTLHQPDVRRGGMEKVEEKRVLRLSERELVFFIDKTKGSA